MGQAEATRDEKLAFAYRHCEAELRLHDPDRYFATLFVPADKRPHLFALYAFSSEISRVRDIAREPLMGEIRLQWWRDAVTQGGGLANSEHPVMTALNDTIQRYSIPVETLISLINARVFDLYEDPMPTLVDLEGYCGETCSVLFQLSAMIVAGRQANSADAAGHGGVAYALAGLLREFPWHSRRRSVYIPGDILESFGLRSENVISGDDTAEMRQALFSLREIAVAHLEKAMALLPSVVVNARVAFLPLSLTSSYLRQIGGESYRPFETLVELPQWRKQWLLWRAARRFR